MLSEETIVFNRYMYGHLTRLRYNVLSRLSGSTRRQPFYKKIDYENTCQKEYRYQI